MSVKTTRRRALTSSSCRSGTMGMTYAELEPQLRERAAQRRAEREGKDDKPRGSKL